MNRLDLAAWTALCLLPFALMRSGAGAGRDRAHAPVTHTVEIRDMAFHPAELQVQAGDTIVWVNHDFVPHTATAPDSAWTSPPLEQGDRWSRLVPPDPGGLYLCAFHPTMEGRITVESDPPAQLTR